MVINQRGSSHNKQRAMDFSSDPVREDIKFISIKSGDDRLIKTKQNIKYFV